jgi:hypothetical protein
MIGDSEVVVVAGEETMFLRVERRKTALLAALFGAFMLVGSVAPPWHAIGTTSAVNASTRPKQD